MCLLGGWAVHATVGSRYRLACGREYIGSRDIDLGFHFEGDEGAEAVRGSALAGTVRSLEGIGYEGAAFRMVKYYARDTRRPLSREEASRVPLYDMFAMYVDLMVDNAPPGAKEALGFVPADEPMIGHAMAGGLSDEVDEFGGRALLPRPEVLLASKIVSMPRRQDGHKRWKDIADMYALAWHSGVETGELRAAVLGLLPQGSLAGALGAVGDGDFGQAAAALGADASHVRAVLSGFLVGGEGGGEAGSPGRTSHLPVTRFLVGGEGGGEAGGAARPPAGAPAAHEGGGGGRSEGGGGSRGGSAWPTPYALGYGKFTALVRALGERAGDGRDVSLRDVADAARVCDHNAAMNLSFLGSVGVVREGERGMYRLTEAGRRYAGAHLSGSPARIKKESRAVVMASHLRRLADEARSRPGMRGGEMLARIKEYAGRPDGPGAGNMQWPASTGARTLLRVIGDAGMLPEGAAA